MNELNRYLESNNAFYQLFGGKVLELSSVEGRKVVASSLEVDLSPENLSMDGELPVVEVRKRRKFLTKALNQLSKLEK